MTPIERATAAIAAMPRIFMRFNDWTGDHVPGFPIEICQDSDDGNDIIVIARYPGQNEYDGIAYRDQHIREATARAVLQALREPSDAMKGAGANAQFGSSYSRRLPETMWQEMIDAALAETCETSENPPAG